MRNARLWERLLGVERTVVEGVVFDEEAGAVVASVRPRKGATRRCGICSRRCAREDLGEGSRRWRTLDLGSIPTYLEADAPRVRCREHGIVVVAFPWARHRARHSSMFEDQVAWLAKHTSRSAVEELMRIAWRSVGAIVSRVVADAHSRADPLDGLRRIGIDEISYKKGFFSGVTDPCGSVAGGGLLRGWSHTLWIPCATCRTVSHMGKFRAGLARHADRHAGLLDGGRRRLAASPGR